MDRSYRIKRALWWAGVVVALGYLVVVIPVVGWWRDAPSSSIAVMAVFWLIVLAVLGRINEHHGFLRAPHDDG